LRDLLYHAEHVAGPEEDARWMLVQRVASSRQLGKASQLRDILLYICRRALIENASSIGEQEIGCKVLGRRPDFNPNEDNIVRAQVRHLRQKLEEYFNSEGTGEPVILTIPKGGYLPHFEPRPTRPAPVTVAKPRRWWRPAMLLWVLLVAGLVATVGVLWRQREAAGRASIATEGAALRPDPLWPRIFAAGRETNIVMADTCMVMLQDILDVDIPLSEYLRGGYPESLIASAANPELHAALKLIATRQYTSLGDAMTAARMMEVSHHYAAHTNMRYSRYLSVREFKTGNFILIGSRRGVPWVQLFEPRMNFYLEEDHQTRKFHFRNRAPLAAERDLYGPTNDGAISRDTFADIALLPNLGYTGYVLILSGLDMAATEAAGEMVASPDFSATLTHLLGARSSQSQSPAPMFEILLQAKAMAGTAADSKVVAYRLVKERQAAFAASVSTSRSRSGN
jgi:hypothetical protein